MNIDLSRLNLRRWALLTFAIACVFINAIVFTLYQKNQQVIEAKQWVQHTYETINTNGDVIFAIQDMNIALRGYLLTNDVSFLMGYRDAEQRLEPAYNHLKDITRDNLSRQIELAELKTILDELRQSMDQQIKDQTHGKAIVKDRVINSRRLMRQIRRITYLILNSERDLLDQRLKVSNAQQQNYMRTIFATAGLSILGLLIANGVIAFLTIRRQAAEDNLRRINKEMEGFTYIASHDLRSPLVNLKGFSSEMAYGISELRPILETILPHARDEDQKKALMLLDKDIPDALHYIHASVEKMDKLTNAILELSRIGRRSLKLDDIDPNQLVRRILDTFQHQIAEKQVQVKVHTMPHVMADLLALEQVFSNVIDNAIKYLDPQRSGKIEIGASRSHRLTTFWVKDNGRGISKADQQKVFEIYRRGGNNENIPGEGMGMAYVRTTLRRMGGMIWCESNLNVGSIFYFTISNTLEKELKND